MRRGRAALAASFALAACRVDPPGPEAEEEHAAGAPRALALEIAADGKPLAVVCSDPSATPGEGPRFLQVFVDLGDGATAREQPPVVGEYETRERGIAFRPRFGFDAGVSYLARDAEGGLLRFAGPSLSHTAATYLSAVSPALPRLPANLLRFYLSFSQPMSLGRAREFVQLREESGELVHGAFLELGEELWDPAGQRLTLLFDPARVKRGLVPHEEEGRALEAGGSYSLLVDAAWPDAAGRPLLRDHRFDFEVVAEDYEQPRLADWTIAPAPVGTREPLVVELDEALDRAQLAEFLSVVGPEGIALPGHVTIDPAATRWSFEPRAAWAEGTHFLVVDSALEDLAGNSLRAPFEIDVFDTVEEQAHELLRRVRPVPRGR